jgi:uncharacterized protein
MLTKSGKLARLKKRLKSMKKVVIAFSGGVDSTFLLKMALDILGKDNVLAVTAKSITFPKREYVHAKRLAQKLDSDFITINTKEIEGDIFFKNPINRCYYCKKNLFGRLVSIAEKKGFNHVIDGFNYDDKKDLRYGSQAAKEFGVRSPLAEARIGKEDIRKFSRKLNLPTWDKSSFACLASRFPYYHEITKKKLRVIDKAEEFLYECGFKQVRVRMHDDIARIELMGNDVKGILLNQVLQKNIVKQLKQLGFSYVTLDLEGYRSGSMNEVLVKKL